MLFSSADLAEYVAARSALRDNYLALRSALDAAFSPQDPAITRAGLDDFITLALALIRHERALHAQGASSDAVILTSLTSLSASFYVFQLLNFLLPTTPEPLLPDPTLPLLPVTISRPSPSTTTFTPFHPPTHPYFTSASLIGNPAVLTVTSSGATVPLILPGTPDALQELIRLLTAVHYNLPSHRPNPSPGPS